MDEQARKEKVRAYQREYRERDLEKWRRYRREWRGITKPETLKMTERTKESGTNQEQSNRMGINLFL